MNIDVEDDAKTPTNEEVVIIEERDKHTYIYIGIAAVLGIALGGLIGSAIATSKWEGNYNHLNERYKQVETEHLQLTQMLQDKLAIEKNTQQMGLSASEALKQKEIFYQQQIDVLTAQKTTLEKTNTDLKAKLSRQKSELDGFKQKTEKLARQTDIQATMFESSRELFKKEQQIDQELAQLQQEHKKLIPQLEKAKKECDIFLEGKSWDVKSDACSHQDELNARINQIGQLIEVNKLDKQQIQSLKDNIGIK